MIISLTSFFSGAEQKVIASVTDRGGRKEAAAKIMRRHENEASRLIRRFTRASRDDRRAKKWTVIYCDDGSIFAWGDGDLTALLIDKSGQQAATQIYVGTGSPRWLSSWKDAGLLPLSPMSEG